MMMPQRKKYWTHAIIWLAIIYATLPIARPISEFLKKVIPFGFSVNILLIVVFLSVFGFSIRKVKIKLFSTYLVLALIAIIGIMFINKIEIPEERIHFIQYGFLAFLIHRALILDTKNARAYFIAFILTAVLGWLDEGIQYLLPDRYYDTRDVVFNALGGILGLVVTFILRREGDYRAAVNSKNL